VSRQAEAGFRKKERKRKKEWNKQRNYKSWSLKLTNSQNNYYRCLSSFFTQFGQQASKVLTDIRLFYCALNHAHYLCNLRTDGYKNRMQNIKHEIKIFYLHPWAVTVQCRLSRDTLSFQMDTSLHLVYLLLWKTDAKCRNGVLQIQHFVQRTPNVVTPANTNSTTCTLMYRMHRHCVKKYGTWG
jgi:hypothetical protein